MSNTGVLNVFSFLALSSFNRVTTHNHYACPYREEKTVRIWSYGPRAEAQKALTICWGPSIIQNVLEEWKDLIVDIILGRKSSQ